MARAPRPDPSPTRSGPSGRVWIGLLLAALLATLLAVPLAASGGHHEAGEKGKASSDASGEKKKKKDEAAASDRHPALTNPQLAKEEAPETFRVRFETTEGDMVLEIHRDWAPRGADRFYNLVKIGYFEDIAFFRVIDGFMMQFGLHGDPTVSRAWKRANFRDDPVRQQNTRGRITFAKTGQPNSRSTQLFINTSDNRNLDRMGFAPIGEVVEGLGVLDEIHVTGEGGPSGPGPRQNRIQIFGNDYLRKDYPKIDYIVKATLLE